MTDPPQARYLALQATVDGRARLAFLAGVVRGQADLEAKGPATRHWLAEAAEVLASVAGCELGPASAREYQAAPLRQRRR